jgi:hypothetical protein
MMSTITSLLDLRLNGNAALQRFIVTIPTNCRSMPDIAVSTENVLTADKSTGCDEEMDATMTSPRNHITSPRNHISSARNHMKTPRRLSLYREEDSNKLSDEDNNRSEDNDSIATTPSTISNCTRFVHQPL